MAALRVRRADLDRTRALRWSFGAFRFLLYGIVGIAAEVVFYTLVRVGRRIPGARALFQFGWHVDSRLGLDRVWTAPLRALFGQCSLWMFLVYAVCAFFGVEFIYRRTARRPVLLRAALYGLAITTFEAASGWALFGLTGFKIWYYDDPLAIAGMTSLAITPLWMVTGLLVEVIYRELMDPRVAEALEAAEASAQPAP